MKISIRRKKTKKGLHVYLDYNTPKNRYEFLNLYLFDENNLGRKLNPQEKNFNKETEIKVQAIWRKRMEQQQNGVLKLYGIDIKKKMEQSFMDYFDKVMNERENTSDSNLGNWRSARNHLMDFIGNRNVLFSNVDVEFLEKFKTYLLTVRTNERELARNTAVSYFTKVRVVIKQAVEEKYFYENPLKKIKSIDSEDTKREFLTIDELKKLKSTPCQNKILKKAFLFSCLTGLRFSDIEKLIWGEIQNSSDTGYFIRLRQKKTKGELTIFVSDEAYEMLGEADQFETKVFQGLYYSAWTNLQLKEWFIQAKIFRKVTFHSGRHTFATLQLNGGTDITVVSNLLGHKNLKTTQIYAKITNTKKIEAVNRISLL